MVGVVMGVDDSHNRFVADLTKRRQHRFALLHRFHGIDNDKPLIPLDHYRISESEAYRHIDTVGDFLDTLGEAGIQGFPSSVGVLAGLLATGVLSAQASSDRITSSRERARMVKFPEDKRGQSGMALT